MSNLNCGWMYERLDGRGVYDLQFYNRWEEDVIDEMYYVNDLHGGTQLELGYDNPYRQMVLDVAGPNFDQATNMRWHHEHTQEEGMVSSSLRLLQLVRGRGSAGREGKSSGRGNSIIPPKMPIVPIPTTVSPQQGGTSSNIAKSFKNELDSNGINWIGVSQPVKDFYFGEFKKEFYWDSSTNENAVKRQWEIKASLRYRDFISRIKKNETNPGYVTDIVWENWMRLWQAPENVTKSETNKKIIVEEDKLFSELIQVDLSPLGNIVRNLLLKRVKTQHQVSSICTSTHMVMMEKILLMSEHELFMKDMKKYYVRKLSGEKKRRIYGLGSQAKSYYGPILCISSQFDASSLVPPSVSQSALMENMDEFVKKLIPTLTDHMIPTLTDHMIPILLERIEGVTYLPSHQSADTPIGDASSATPMVPNKVVSDDDHISSP
ncbi:hypothetical protein KY290_006350 [Solanum tuberosum]|uniref:Integrase core domain containing protein n=1 Tax=Solanum tuberosum TaxID=4113 RepID=A0ABQ7WIM2_SOLTU|nr:hypothetical protein KY290_006350 [Solanum tuberosum]